MRRLHRDFGTDPQSAAFQLAVVTELCPLLTLPGIKSDNQRKAVLEGSKAAFTAAVSRLAFFAQKSRDGQLKGWCEQAQICFAAMSGAEYVPAGAVRRTHSPAVPVAKPEPKAEPKISNDGHKWTIANYHNHNPVTIDGLTQQSSVSVCDCSEVVISLPADKVCAVFLDKCDRVGLMTSGDVIAAVELVNSRKCQVQVKGHLPNVVIEQCEGVTVHVSKESRDVKIVSSRSSEVNLLHFFSTIGEGKEGMECKCVEECNKCETECATCDTDGDARMQEEGDADMDGQQGEGEGENQSSSSSSGCECDHHNHQKQKEEEEDVGEAEQEQREVAIPFQFLSYFDADGHLITEPVQHSGN